MCFCCLFIEMKCTLVRFPSYITGSSLEEPVKIENTRRSQVEMMYFVYRGSDCKVTRAGKTRHRN